MLVSHASVIKLGKESQKAKRKANEKYSFISRSMPTIYGFINDEYIIPNKYHKIIVSSRYLLIYQIKDNIVYIEFIVDCRQDYQ